MKALSDKDLKELAVAPGPDQCRAFDEMARRVKENPDKWAPPDEPPWRWTPLCWTRAPNATEIEWTFLMISDRYNDGADRSLQEEQSARINELQHDMDENSMDIACKYHNAVVELLAKRRRAPSDV